MNVEMRPIDKVTPYARNPRAIPAAAIAKVAASLAEFGFRQPIVVDKEGVVVVGHTRLEAARSLGMTEVPVHVASELTPVQARAYRLMDNRSHEEAAWDKQLLGLELEEIDQFDIDLAVTGFDPEELEGLLAPTYTDPHDFDKETEPSKRNLPIDIIFTVNGAGGFCCMACKAGWKYGIQSANEGKRMPLCLYHQQMRSHQLTFVDNDYFHYDHAVHTAVVAEHRPKYATVRDIMSKEQCRAAGIEFYAREQVIDWAWEIAEHAENVIVIPKYDCLDKIPEPFMLGYSIPSSHGGTPLPLNLFKGRRVHLLGGSWSLQRAALTELADDVVSLDNNYLMKTAAYGSFVYPNGASGQLSALVPDNVTNPMYIALALSMGHVAAEVNRLYEGSAPSQEPNKEDVESLRPVEHCLEEVVP